MKDKHKKLLSHLGITQPIQLGKGMQSIVYDYSKDKIVKIWLDPLINLKRLQELKTFYQNINWSSNKISIPNIYEVGSYEGIFFSIEKKLIGENASHVYLKSDVKTRKSLLNNYFDILDELKLIEIDGEYGEQFTGQLGRITNTDWSKFIQAKLNQTRERTIKYPDHNIEDIERLFNKYFAEILPKLPKKPTKILVHGDLFLENILATDDGKVTSLLDFSPLTVAGDHLMDVAGLVHFVEISEEVTSEARDYLTQLAQQKYPNKQEDISNYLLYYSLLFINSKSYDPRTYDWCKRNLLKYGYLT